jgi:putative hydrolase of the HAD superfamily
MGTTTILFDLDNTLVPELQSYELAFANATDESAGRLGFNRDALRTAVFDVATELWLASRVSAYCLRLGLGSPTSLLSDFPGDSEELAYLREWAPSYRQESWVRGLARVGITDSAALALELDQAFRKSLRNRCVAYDDVIPVLEVLSPTYAFAVATNGPADVQATKLIASGLERFFPVVVASSEVGFGKPDPRIFTITVERLGVDAAEVLVVGDSVEKDVVGAAAAHLRCVWLNRTGATRKTKSAPDFEIESLTALPSLLA